MLDDKKPVTQELKRLTQYMLDHSKDGSDFAQKAKRFTWGMAIAVMLTSIIMSFIIGAVAALVLSVLGLLGDVTFTEAYIQLSIISLALTYFIRDLKATQSRVMTGIQLIIEEGTRK